MAFSKPTEPVMQLRFVRTPDENEQQELHRMTQQEVGRVAERARLVLLTPRGFDVPEICRIFELTDDTIYKWFDRFDAEGPEGLFDRERSGRPREIDEEAEAELERLLEHPPLEEGYAFTTWTVPLLRSHLREQLDLDVSDQTVRRALHRLEFVWRRPRWFIDYEDPDYADRMAAIAQAILAANDEVSILLEDETTFRRLPPLRQMWMRRGQQAQVAVPASNGKFSLYGVLEARTGETLVEPYPKGKSCYTKAFLERVMERFSGKVLLIWDHARWHTSQAVETALAQYDRLEVLRLPKRAPQQNPVEDLWRELKRIVAANLERSLEALKTACREFFNGLSKQDALRITGLAA
jgi:transposase